MQQPFHCRCRAIRGYLSFPRHAGRALCYCKDCQAYARFLGAPERLLDARGGTEVVAVLPRHVHFTQGLEHLQCMSLSERGILRWYAGCCGTPIANTPRTRRLAYAGLPRACLPGSDAELDQAFGRRRMVVNTGSATQPVRASSGANFLGIVKIMKNVLGARLSGAYRDNPFFDPASGEPIRPARNLTPAERQALDDAAPGR